MKIDIIIENGEIIDGTGQLRYKADVGIDKGKIIAEVIILFCKLVIFYQNSFLSYKTY